MSVYPDTRTGVIGFRIQWNSPRFHFLHSRVEKYNITWKAVHTKLIKHAEKEETEPDAIQVVSTNTQGQLTKGETYEITVVSVSYDTYSIVNGSNQKNDSISKFSSWIFQCKT